MDPDFIANVDELERTIGTLKPNDVYVIRKGGEPAAVLIHPDLYDDLLAAANDAPHWKVKT